MKRLSGADSFMLGMETSKAYMHTFKVAIIDPSTDPNGWSFEKFYAESVSRLHLVPMLRWKYVDSPFGLNHPYWVDDPDFDPHYHIRRVACPPPGDHRTLCEFMSAVYCYKLDRDRPLWMEWVVEGLEGGKVAVVVLVHHAYVDGVGAAWLMQQFYGSSPGARPGSIPQWNPAPLPSWLTRLSWALRDWPEVMIGNLPKVAVGLWRKYRLERRQQLSGKPQHPNAGMMKQTPINVALSAGRTFVCDSVPLERFVTISRGLGVTINDVFSSCVAGAVRHLLKDMNYDPDTHPLIGGTPFAGKRPEGMEGLGNFATLDYCWVHSEIADPRKRLEASQQANAEMKQHLKEVRDAGADINAIMQILPPWAIRMLRKAIHRAGGRVSFFGNLVLSNVPGPREPLYLDHWKLANWFSTGQIIDGSALNITMWSYCGQANICILIDREVLKDGWKLYGYFIDELDALAAIVRTTEGTT